MSTDDNTPIPNNGNRFFNFTFENGIIITIILVGCYFISLLYIQGFNDRLGIIPLNFNYAVEYVLSQGLAPLLVSLVICLLFLIGINSESNNIFLRLLANIPIFVSIVGLLIVLLNAKYIIKMGVFFFIFSLIIVAGSLVFFLIIIFNHEINFTKWVLRKDIIYRFLVIFLLLLALGAIAQIMGTSNATSMIECKNGCTHIEFIFKDPNYSYINSQNLIYLAYYDEKYFVTYQQIPAPFSPEIQIIPDDMVQLTKMRQYIYFEGYNLTTF